MKKLEEQHAAFAKACLLQHTDMQKQLDQMRIETLSIKETAENLASAVDTNQDEVLEVLGKLHNRATRTLHRYVDLTVMSITGSINTRGLLTKCWSSCCYVMGFLRHKLMQ